MLYDKSRRLSFVHALRQPHAHFGIIWFDNIGAMRRRRHPCHHDVFGVDKPHGQIFPRVPVIVAGGGYPAPRLFAVRTFVGKVAPCGHVIGLGLGGAVEKCVFFQRAHAILSPLGVGEVQYLALDNRGQKIASRLPRQEIKNKPALGHQYDREQKQQRPPAQEMRAVRVAVRGGNMVLEPLSASVSTENTDFVLSATKKDGSTPVTFTLYLTPKPKPAPVAASSSAAAVGSSDGIQQGIAGVSPQAASALSPVFRLVDGGRPKTADVLDK